MSDITKQSLSELVKNIKSKKLSSSEATKAFVERSEKSKELNAYITEDYANALVISLEESFLLFIFSTNSVNDCLVISDIIQLPLVLQNNLHFP